MFEAFFKGEAILLAPILIVFSGALGAEILALTARVSVNRLLDDRMAIFERPLISILLGSVVIGMFLYGVSLFGWLGIKSAYTIVAIEFLALLRGQFIRDVRASIWSLSVGLRETGRFTAANILIALAFLGGFALLSLVFAARPSFDADTSSTYIWAAKQFAYHGSLFDNGHAIGAMAKSGFLQLDYGLLLASPMLGHALLILLTVVGVALLFTLLTRIAGAAFALLSLVVLLASQFAFEAFVVPAKFDGLSFAYGAAVLSLTLRAAQKGITLGETILIAAFIGSAASLSYNNLIAGVVFALACAALILRRENKAGLFLAGIAAGIFAAAPTYLQNLMLYANPIYPFAGKVFPAGIGSTIPATSYFAKYIDFLGRDMTISSLRELPTLLTGILTDNGLSSLQASRETWFGLYFAATTVASVLVLATVIWALVCRKENVDIFRLLAGAGWIIIVLSWAYTQHILRYLCFAMPLAMAAMAYITDDIQRLVRRWCRPASVAVPVVTIALSALCFHDWFAVEFAKYKEVGVWLLGGQSSEEYFEKNYRYGGIYAFGEVISQLNHELPPGSKILSFINGNSYFSAGFDVYLGNGSNALPAPDGVAKPLTEFASWEEWRAHLTTQGFEYVVIEPKYLYLTPQEEPAVLGFMAAEKPWQVIGTTNVYKL